MVLRGSMDLRSYDRLFPNQDTARRWLWEPDRGTATGTATTQRVDRLPRPRHPGTAQRPMGISIHCRSNESG
jgi:hypothetical protein